MLSLQQHSDAIQTEQIATVERSGALGHFGYVHPSGVGSPNERPNARAGDYRRLYSELLEGPKDADMRETLEPAPTEDERNLVRFTARLAG